MAISNFSDLKAAIGNWLARSDLSIYLEDIILLGEQRLRRDLRIRETEADLSVTLSSGTATIPTDFAELKWASLDGSPTYPLEQKDSEWITRRFPLRSSSGIPQFIAVDGTEFIFGQFPAADYDLIGKYWKEPTLLSDSNTTNEWITATSDALLMACLAESAPFLKEDQRVQIWESKYMQIKDGYNNQRKRQSRRGAVASYK